MKTKTSWREKLEKPQERQIKPGPPGRGMMLIPTALDIDGIVRRVGKGNLVKDTQIREYLAKKYGSDFT
jgi:hypothetical protein